MRFVLLPHIFTHVCPCPIHSHSLSHQLESAFEFGAIKATVADIVSLFPHESHVICGVDTREPMTPADLLATVCLKKAKTMRASKLTEGSLVLLDEVTANTSKTRIVINDTCSNDLSIAVSELVAQRLRAEMLFTLTSASQLTPNQYGLAVSMIAEMRHVTHASIVAATCFLFNNGEWAYFLELSPQARISISL